MAEAYLRPSDEEKGGLCGRKDTRSRPEERPPEKLKRARHLGVFFADSVTRLEAGRCPAWLGWTRLDLVRSPGRGLGARLCRVFTKFACA